MISPMKNEREQPLSESSHSTSTTGPNSSSNSSIIYKPSSDSSSENSNQVYIKKEPSKIISETQQNRTTQQQPTPQQKQEQQVQQNQQKNQVPLSPTTKQPNMSNQMSPKEPEKVHNNLSSQVLMNGISSKDSVPEEDNSVSIVPMRPLFRGYCSTLTLPSRHRPTYQMMQPEGMGDYCEIGLANGYMSDGEVLRNSPREITDGYMSEGGSVLYARRLQTMPAHIPNG